MKYILAFYSKFIEQDTFLHCAQVGQTMTEFGDTVCSFLPKLKIPPWLLLFNDSQIIEIYDSLPDVTISRLSFYEYNEETRKLGDRFILFQNGDEYEKAYLEETNCLPRLKE